MRGLYRDKKGIVIGFKPILAVSHSNFMPMVDSDDSAARNRLWVARFGSTFPADLVEPDVHRRRFPRIENLRETMRAWAPYHFLLMLEALRDCRRRSCVLPVGAQQLEGSLMAHATRKSWRRRRKDACALGWSPTTRTYRCARRTPGPGAHEARGPLWRLHVRDSSGAPEAARQDNFREDAERGLPRHRPAQERSGHCQWLIPAPLSIGTVGGASDKKDRK